MNWHAIFDWIASAAYAHKEALALFGIAMAVTMRPKLPWPFYRIEMIEWTYEWIRDATMTFISMRGPAHAESTAHEKTVTNQDGKVVEASVKIESSTTIPGSATMPRSTVTPAPVPAPPTPDANDAPKGEV